MKMQPLRRSMKISNIYIEHGNHDLEFFELFLILRFSLCRLLAKQCCKSHAQFRGWLPAEWHQAEASNPDHFLRRPVANSRKSFQPYTRMSAL